MPFERGALCSRCGHRSMGSHNRAIGIAFRSYGPPPSFKAAVRGVDGEQKMSFEVGHKVRLKGGGAVMVVGSVGTKWITCDWHDHYYRPQRENYAVEELELVTDRPDAKLPQALKGALLPESLTPDSFERQPE
jgi:uncharacterized protein YodC (DUF2158 family)